MISTGSGCKTAGFDELQKLFSVIEKGRDGLPRIALEDIGRFGPPIVPTQNRCIGRNTEHARESNSAVPVEPVCFQQDLDSAAGAYDPLPMPLGVSMELHWRPDSKQQTIVQRNAASAAARWTMKLKKHLSHAAPRSAARRKTSATT